MTERTPALTLVAEEDDYSRKVYCLLGIPVDAITMDSLLERMARAVASRSRFFFSTPNLNFLILSQHDLAFRRSLLQSDVCCADGVGVILLCRLLGIPITTRVAGSDIPTAISRTHQPLLKRPIAMAFFGGGPGVGKLACKAVNSGDTDRLTCVGAIDPGTINSDNIADSTLLERVNATAADFLLVALGAQKGQAWILHNLDRLNIPIISHLGATLNFLAGTVQRAPLGFQRLGLEWLWRIKEEPRLATRYSADGVQLIWLMVGKILPLAVWLLWTRMFHKRTHPSARVVESDLNVTRLVVSGAVPDRQLQSVASSFRRAALSGNPIILDLTGLRFFEMGFAGFIVMLERTTQKQNQTLSIVGSPPSVNRALAWCGLKHLIRNK